MVGHIRRVHPNEDKENFPEWIEIEKEKRRKASRAKSAGARSQAVQARRESTPLTQSPGSSEVPASSESAPLKSQVQVHTIFY